MYKYMNHCPTLFSVTVTSMKRFCSMILHSAHSFSSETGYTGGDGTFLYSDRAREIIRRPLLHTFDGFFQMDRNIFGEI